jgi:hypothetical protein
MWSLGSIRLAVARSLCKASCQCQCQCVSKSAGDQARKYCTLMGCQPGDARDQVQDGTFPLRLRLRTTLGWASLGPCCCCRRALWRLGAARSAQLGQRLAPPGLPRSRPITPLVRSASTALGTVTWRRLRAGRAPRHERWPRGTAGRRHATPRPPGSNLATGLSGPPMTARDLPQGTEPARR